MIDRQKMRRCLASLVSLSSVLASTLCVAGERGVQANYGILNFGVVDERVYRGAQPDEPAMVKLKELGIKTIINLRMPNDVLKEEPIRALGYAMVYTNVPMTGVGKPTDEQINQILSLLETLPTPIFIHCEHGCDRTGTVVACYRIKHSNWSADAAFREAKAYGLSPFERGMRSYILGFSKSPKKETPALAVKK
jgi:protein tyrosine/serine phosphatase